jgi:uncharacterized protein (TIGR02996 family)
MNEDAFERGLVESPNELVRWSAYTDYLFEKNDPRGEFMLTQISLEDEKLTKAQRDELKKKEKELLEEHEQGWLGNLAPHFRRSPAEDPSFEDYDRPTKPSVEYHWQRGFLNELKADCLTVALAQALRDSDALRLLQKLHVTSTAYYLSMQENAPPRRIPGPVEYRGYDEWLELLGAPFLGSLRVFQMGDTDGEPPEEGWGHNHTYAPGIERVIAEMTRIEELHLLCKEYDPAALFSLPNLTNLRVLRMYALGEPNSDPEHFEIPLDALAANPALGNLTHLMLHPHFADNRSFIPLSRVAPLFHSPHLKRLTHLQLRLSDMGDDGVRELISSGLLKRLKHLDLRHGAITDTGARLFAACPETQGLERLDLSRNAVTPQGLRILRQAGIQAIANNPLTVAELESREYLHDGDFE